MSLSVSRNSVSSFFGVLAINSSLSRFPESFAGQRMFPFGAGAAPAGIVEASDRGSPEADRRQTLLLFLAGTFLPFLRASDRLIAIACFLLVTFFPLLPLFSVPCLRLCMARSTSLVALRDSFAIVAILVFTPGNN